MYHAYTMHTLHAPCIVTQDLIKKLLTADLTKRLGNLKAGADDVKKHKWFTACTPPTNFEALLAGKGEAPIKARRAARAMGHTRTRDHPTWKWARTTWTTASPENASPYPICGEWVRR